MNRDETGFPRRAARMQIDFLKQREGNRADFPGGNGAIRMRECGINCAAHEDASRRDGHAV